MERLKKLYEETFGASVSTIESMKGDGSDRKIYRIRSQNHSVVGIVHENRAENRAFLEFTRHFFRMGLKVPEIYAINKNITAYIEQDLGDYTLIQWMNLIRPQKGFAPEIIDKYRQIVRILPEFQIRAGKGLDYSLCYQHIEFGEVSMWWDLEYFHNRFLTPFHKKPIDQDNLYVDFDHLVKFLLEEERDYFLYRDFQSRNVMIFEDTPYFIDYQSGRKGSLQYDLASLLYDAKARVPEEIREELREEYLQSALSLIKIDRQRFNYYFNGFALIRIMQAFGAYGFLSIVKGKKHFLQSVPFAIENLEILLHQQDTFLKKFPTLRQVFIQMTEDPALREF